MPLSSDVTFECNIGVARELFGRLLVGLKTWTTTERHIQQVFLEDVYSVLGFEEDIDDSQHRLAAPYPFFESRQVFCEELDKKLLSTEKKVVFLSGDPGSGKTSTISYLQATTSKCRRSVFRWRKFVQSPWWYSQTLPRKLPVGTLFNMERVFWV